MFSSIQSIPGLIFARSDVKAKIRPGVEARLCCDTCTNRLGQRLLWQEQPNNLANLPKYAVQGRGATKQPAPESPRTASLKPTLVLCLATVYCTAVQCCYSCTCPI